MQVPMAQPLMQPLFPMVDPALMLQMQMMQMMQMAQMMQMPAPAPAQMPVPPQTPAPAPTGPRVVNMTQSSPNGQLVITEALFENLVAIRMNETYATRFGDTARTLLQQYCSFLDDTAPLQLASDSSDWGFMRRLVCQRQTQYVRPQDPSVISTFQYIVLDRCVRDDRLSRISQYMVGQICAPHRHEGSDDCGLEAQEYHVNITNNIMVVVRPYDSSRTWDLVVNGQMAGTYKYFSKDKMTDAMQRMSVQDGIVANLQNEMNDIRYICLTSHLRETGQNAILVTADKCLAFMCECIGLPYYLAQ